MKWLEQIKLSHRLMLSLLSFFVLIVAMGFHSLRQLDKINSQVWEIHSNWMPATHAATEMKNWFNAYRIAVFQHLVATDPAEVAYTEQEAKKRLEYAYQEQEKRYADTIVRSDERALYDKSKKLFNDYLAISQQMVELNQQGKKAEALALMRGKSRDIKNEFTDAMDKLIQFNVDGGRNTARASAELVQTSRTETYYMFAMLIAFELLGFYVVRKFSRSVWMLHRVGVHTCTSANELAAVIHQQEATIEEQAASSHEIVASAKEISATAKELNSNMDEIVHIAEQTSRQASDSQHNLTRLDETMHQLVDASNTIASKLAILNEKAGNINSVVNLIVKIADQTNLLSLNAAIEAEKAGEYGLGFSVVATEIRRLSDQTSIATFDIEQILKEMQSQVSISVMGMDKFAEEVRRNVDVVRNISHQLTDLIEQTKALSPRFELIYEGMQAQNLGTEQITESMSQFSEGMHQSADAIRNSRKTVTLLTEASQDVQRVVKALA